MSCPRIPVQLRYLQTLADMSNTNSSTIVFPLPMELITTFLKDNKPASPDKSDPDKPDTGA